jgi:hypothetical protein
VPETISPIVEAPEASSVIDVRELDWKAVSSAVDPAAIRARMRGIVERMEALLDRADGPGLLFDADRNHAEDRAIKVAALDLACPLWIVGDLHGDLLALEAALALIDEGNFGTGEPALGSYSLVTSSTMRIGLEVLLRVFELLVDTPELICILAGNHDEALSYDGVRFASSVEPSNFATSLMQISRMNGWSGPANWRCDCSRARRAPLLARRDARRPRGLSLWRTCIRSSSRTRIGTIPHACLISCGPGAPDRAQEVSQSIFPRQSVRA